jgi:hypothetical protein
MVAQFSSSDFFDQSVNTSSSPVTAAKWMMNSHVIVSFGDGSIFLKSITEPTKKATLLYKELYNPVRDLALVSFSIVFAMESGDVKTIPVNLESPVQVKDAVKLCSGLRQSATCLDYLVTDKITLLACGFEDEV